MVALGTPAPTFSLPDTISGRIVSLADSAGAQALLVMFLCNHCPYVKHIRVPLAQLARDYQSRNVAILAISSNDADRYPADGPVRMQAEAKEAGYPFPYLHDETQSVAKAYHAACTPDFFLFDRERRLAYRGQLDDSRPGNGIPVTGKDLRAALDALLDGGPPASAQTPSMGCSIKWKPGNAPSDS